MSLRNRLAGAVLSLMMIITCGIAAYAQQKPAADKTAPQGFAEGHRKGGRHHGTPVLRIMKDLNLTDAQQQQARAIVERFRNTIEPQRQSLKELHRQKEEGTLPTDANEKAQALRAQIDEAQQRMREELLALLTPEQRTQYDQREKEWKARRDEMRSRRGRNQQTMPEGQ